MGYFNVSASFHDSELEKFMRAAKLLGAVSTEATEQFRARAIDNLVEMAPYIASCIERNVPAADRDWDLRDEEDDLPGWLPNA